MTKMVFHCLGLTVGSLGIIACEITGAADLAPTDETSDDVPGFDTEAPDNADTDEGEDTTPREAASDQDDETDTEGEADLADTESDAVKDSEPAVDTAFDTESMDDTEDVFGDSATTPPDSGESEPEEDFSVILLPDTQNYTKHMADNADNTYYKQAQWIVDHMDSYNIKHVIHLGDITNDNTVAQWTIADKAHAILDKAKVPYSIATGNHDYRIDGGISRSKTLLNDYFPPSRFKGNAWYGGSMGSGSENNYTFFEAGGLAFMVLSLEFAPRRHTLCWADEVIAAHPNHRVIIVTHCYLTVGGGYSANCSLDDYDLLGAAGETLFTELASRHSNIFMVVSGHVGESAYTPTTGNNGNDIHQMVVDYQFEVPCSAASPSSCNDNCHTGDVNGNGWLRRLVFSPSTNTIRSETITVEAGNTAVFPQGTPTFFCSPYNTADYNRYAATPDAADHAFTMSYDMSAAVSYAYDDLGSDAFQSQTVNSKGTGQQLLSDIAMNAEGAFAIVWEDDSSDADGAGNTDIHVRGFEPGGCERFHDVVVNEDTTGQQNAPAIAMDRQGNFAVVWQDDRDENGIYQIYARGFDPDGTERFNTMTVNAVADRQQTHPKIAMAPDGRFVVVWENNTKAAPNYQVFARRFDADGTALSGDIQVNPNADGAHLFPAVAMDSQGGFVVVWQDDTDDNGWYQIHGRGFSAGGQERLARFTVNTDDTGQQLRPDIAMDESGGFVVVFEDDYDKDDVYRILARGYNADGSARFADTRISPETPGQIHPSVAMMPDGDWVAAWQDDQDGNDFFEVHGRGLHADGSGWFARFTVNEDSTGQQLRPTVGVSAIGTAVFVWDDDTDGNDYFQIHARGVDGDSL